MKNLYFIRHGISLHNVLFIKEGKKVFYDKRYYDTGLTSDGIEQSVYLRNTWNGIDKIDLTPVVF